MARGAVRSWWRRPSLSSEHDMRAAYEEHGSELYRFALRGTGDDGAAQDVVQETFLRAFRAADRYDPERASLRVWLFAITRNVVADHHRTVAARPWLRGLTGDPARHGEHASTAGADPSERLIQAWVVDEALRRIGAEHRHAVVETYLRDRPYVEVAAELGVPVGTVRSRVFYGLKALRVVLEEMEVTL